jgi:ribosomal protein S18 acetylase RimI-like enzyme
MSEPAIRAATPEDVGVLLELIRALARFERAPDAVVATEADLLRDGFGTTPRFEARLAFVDGKAAGFTLFFHNYSTWEGRPGLYLEDIYVHDWARRRGVGRALIADLARLAIARECARLDFAVLHWNPARAFYEALGIGPLDEWVPYRARGEALEALARLG